MIGIFGLLAQIVYQRMLVHWFTVHLSLFED